MKKIHLLFFVLIAFQACKRNDNVAENEADTTYYREPHRPQFHFTPEAHWMNDPNGMVFYNGEYHLFYQYYPDGDVWGPMHWGHATSGDLIHWKHLPIALYPDSLGLIFSGSAVVDKTNSSGFGSKENPPLVAIFTYHSMEKEKAGRTDYQNQGIAYSTDSGKTWTKYERNPVLKNHGIKDFRDPKVSWHEETKKWVMTLAVKDHIEFYGSSDLKTWRKLSDFGLTYGAHGGVWECPDLLQLPVVNSPEKKWVLIVSINPGGPNGGSATQYFIGDFNGHTFTCDAGPSKTSWVDYGPDNYAGVTWSSAPDGRKIFLGWMSNWAYATQVPTSPWRSAMTVPRDVSLTKVDNGYLFTSQVARELRELVDNSKKIAVNSISDSLEITKRVDFNISTSLITGRVEAKDFYFELANERKQMVKIGYDSKNNRFYTDRSLSGKTTFSPEFFGQAFAPRLVNKDVISFTMVVDVSSVEVFFDDGTSVMSALVFPDVEYQTLSLNASGALKVHELEIGHIPSVWANRRQQE